MAAVCLFMGVICSAGCENYNIPISQTNTGVSSGGATGISVTLAPAGIIFVDVGKSRAVIATLAGDTGNQGVNWSLSGPGSLSNATTTSVNYNAPASVDVPATVSATSVADPTQVASATMYSVPVPTIQTTPLPGGTAGQQYNEPIIVNNGAAPFTWSLAGGSLPPGVQFFVASQAAIVLEGVPTQAGTFNFTMEVTDVTSVSAKQAFTVVISAASGGSGQLQPAATLGGGGVNNALLQGNYAFQFGGFGPNGMVGAAGNLTADGNGNISAGTVDRNSAAGAQKGLAFAGTYAVGANQLGEMTLEFGDGTSATYAIAVSSGGNARFIEFDGTAGTGTNGSGEMKKQNATSLPGLKLAGNYTFELTGVDAQGARMAVAGEFAADGNGALSEGALDANDAGTMTSQTALTGSYAPSVGGAGSAVMNVTGTGTVHLSLYPISADEMFAVETDGAGQPLLVGSILRQSAGPFTNATFAGNDVVQMMGTGSGATQMIFGLMNADGAGNAVLSAAQMTNEGVSEMDATYTMAMSSRGRAVLGPAAGSPLVYLVGPNEGFVLGTDSSVMTGWIQGQTAGTMTTASFSGTIAGASLFPASSGVTESIVSLSFDGKGNVSGTGASSGPDGLTLLPIQQGTYSVSAGDLFLSITWPLQNPQPMLIDSPGRLIVVPSGAQFAPIVLNK